MKTVFLFLILLFANKIVLFAQGSETKSKSDMNEKAEFPGGYPALCEYILNNFSYQSEVFEFDINGEAIIQFRIKSNGKVDSVSILKKLQGCDQCNKEALRVIQKMPNWIPALKNGVYTESWFIIPFIFGPYGGISIRPPR